MTEHPKNEFSASLDDPVEHLRRIEDRVSRGPAPLRQERIPDHDWPTIDDFSSEQMYLLFALRYLDAPDPKIRQARPLLPTDTPNVGGEIVLTALLMNPALAGSLVAFPGGLIPLSWPVLERWLWAWRRYRRFKRFEGEVRRVVEHYSMSAQFKRQRVARLFFEFWEETDHPLGPDGLSITTMTGWKTTSRTGHHPSDFQLTDILRDAASTVLNTLVNQTFGRLLNRAGVDAGEIVAELAPALVDALDLSGSIQLESTWAQIWVYPEEIEAEARQIVNAKRTPARRVAVAIAGAPNPTSFGVGEHLSAISGSLSPIADFIQRVFNEPEKLALDVLTGQVNPGDLQMPQVADLQAEADAVIHGIEDLFDEGGLHCTPTESTAGNRVTRTRACRREIYYEAMAGPIESISAHLWQGTHEVYPVALINTMVMAGDSRVFLRHHALFYKAAGSISFRTDFKDVLKDAMENIARRMLSKVIDKIIDALTPEQLRDLVDWLRS